MWHGIHLLPGESTASRRRANLVQAATAIKAPTNDETTAARALVVVPNFRNKNLSDYLTNGVMARRLKIKNLPSLAR